MAKANFVVTVDGLGPEEGEYFTSDFTVVSVGVIIYFDTDEGEVKEALIPWHRVKTISAIQRGSISATFPL